MYTRNLTKKQVLLCVIWAEPEAERTVVAAE
jgi:hypothetical protein